MARQKTELGAATEKRMKALLARGGTAESITKELRAAGLKVSRATIGRRMRELRGAVRVGRVAKRPKEVAPESPPAPPSAGTDIPLPASPDAIPEGLSVEMLLPAA